MRSAVDLRERRWVFWRGGRGSVVRMQVRRLWRCVRGVEVWRAGGLALCVDVYICVGKLGGGEWVEGWMCVDGEKDDVLTR